MRLRSVIQRFRLAPSAAGWGVAWLVLPQLVLGTWLAAVPDHRAFLTNQLVTLLHVGLGLLSVPFVLYWAVTHARRMPDRARRATRATTLVRWLLASATGVAMVTGYVVLWGGDIITTHRVHDVCGIAVGVPLAMHLALGARFRGAVGVVALLVVATAGSVAARRLLPAQPLDAPIPAFAYQTRPVELYESARWCGECHGAHYAEWKQSTHARTLELPTVQDAIARSPESVGFDLGLLGRVVHGDKLPHSDKVIFACEACHAPTSYYGDDPQPMATAKGVSSEGVTCSFCHTLRAVTQDGTAQRNTADLRQTGVVDFTAFAADIPSFVSAPETVRRYLGQSSRTRIGRAIAGWLIRWRPSVHSADYHSTVLDRSSGCLACHGMGALDSGPEVPHKTYISWKESAFNTGDPTTTVTCMDCHMTERFTGEPTAEVRPAVDWGPDRAHGRSHRLLGGNVAAARALGDADLAAREHELNAKSARVGITSVRAEADGLSVGVAVHTDKIGHYLPSMETHNRYAWVKVRALDAAGHELAATPPPKGEEDFDGPSPLMFRCTEQPKAECDTLVRPRTTREFSARLAVPPGAPVARLEAELHFTLDDAPIATASRPYVAPQRP